MTPRKRKKKPRKVTESSQVELLPGAGPAAPEIEPDEVEAGDDPNDSIAAETEKAYGQADRWARAVGRREPVRPPDPRPAVGESPPVSDETEKTEPEERHRSARDHAAASVRPAGEPLARAKELVEHGRIHEAMELYLGILTVNATNLKAHNNLGVLLDGLKQYDAALEHFEEAERLAPENVEVLTNFASTLTAVARYERAEELLRRAQRLSPEDLDVHLGIGILYFRRGLYGQAEAELRWVCARDRDNGPAFYYRGEALNRLGRFDEAFQALEHAIALLPDDPRAYYTLGHLYDRKSQPNEAGEMYRRARRLQSP